MSALRPPTIVRWALLALAALSTPTPLLTQAIDPAAARFLAAVAPLVSAAEREAYLALQRPYQRAAFERSFWAARDPFPETAVNELEERWLQRAPVALERWESFEDARAVAFAAAGEPTATVRVTCSQLLRPLEIWSYAAAGRARGGVVLVFVSRGVSAGAPFRAWSAREGIFDLTTALSGGRLELPELLGQVAESCTRGREIAELLPLAVDWEEWLRRGNLLPRSNDEWLLRFTSQSTELPVEAKEMPAELSLRFPGSRGLRTVVEAAIRLAEKPAPAARFALDGEVLRGEELFEQFRYRFQPTPAGEAALLFERPLRPGTYRLVLRLHETTADRYFRVERELVVPAIAAADSIAAASPDPAAEATGLAAEGSTPATPAAEVAANEPAVRLRVATERLVTGKLRLDATVKGDAIAAVTFTLNGKPVLTKRRPPFGVELDLGRAPQLHRVGAVASDREGRELARDEAVLNGGPHRFALRLLEPKSIPLGAERVVARAEIELPEGERLDRVEFHVNDRLYATLYQPPFVQSLPVAQGSAPAWIRAVGYLVGGGAAEEVRLVGSGEFAAHVEIDFVELHATALDRRGHVVEDLRSDEIELSEAGQRQEIRRFELVRDLPIHAAVMIDTSASMVEELEEAERAALRFFSEVLTERDRAAVFTFADEPHLVVRFSGALEVLAGGLADLESGGETRLWDAAAFALHYFSGIRGKRALVLLSDGVDSGSRFGFDEVLDYARRTGVAIYAIGINVPSTPPEAGLRLDRLARETGGRAFRIQRAGELGSIYTTIETELRAQYLIAYQSTSSDLSGFREIELKPRRAGVRLRTVSGYYP